MNHVALPCICSSKTTWPDLPRLFAWYMAMSAFRRMCSGLWQAGQFRAMPMLAEEKTSCAPSLKGGAISLWMRSATRMASSWVFTSSSSMANSSPPGGRRCRRAAGIS
jgi:hypothetical protein